MNLKVPLKVRKWWAKYTGPFDDLEAQQELGGYPFTNDELKAQGLNLSLIHI